MKNILLLCTLCFLTVQVCLGQCTPDPQYANAPIGVYPPPQDLVIGNTDSTGLDGPACQGEFYDQLFTAVVPPTIEFGGTDFDLGSIEVIDVSGLPSGINYVCNPPNCTFLANTSGCVLLSGTTNDPIGDYELSIAVDVLLPALSPTPIPFSFPDTTGVLPGGQYILEVLAAGSCILSIESNAIGSAVSVFPNPAINNTEIEFSTTNAETIFFSVFNITGELIHESTIESEVGINTIPFHVGDLNQGIYLFTLSDGVNKYTDRLIVGQ